MTGKLTGADVAEHNSKDSCWVIVHGKAYDVTGVGWMDWFELFGRIFACILEDDLLTPGVFCEILA
jgi:hypothetical protein